MGIFNKQNKNEEELSKGSFVNNDEPKAEEVFVSDISLYELEKADWGKFGRVLKQNRILPNSYIKSPTAVQIKLTPKGSPMVLLSFNSATSNSTRKFMLLQDGAFQIVNGAIDNGKNQNLIKVWKAFQEEIRYISKLNTNREAHFNKLRAVRMMKQAEKIMKMSDIYVKEQAFLERYKDISFDGFYFSSAYSDCGVCIPYGGLPQFVPLKQTKDGKWIDGEPVLPFTPKTLEFCILHMTNGQKIEDGADPEYFEQKCRTIQKFSCFESDDWDRVIKLGRDVVVKQYQEDCEDKDSQVEFEPYY